MSNRKRIRRPLALLLRHSTVAGQLPPGTVALVQVKHDDWCAIWQGRACNCEPIVELPELLIDEVR